MEIRGKIRRHSWGKVGSRSFSGKFYFHSTKRNLIDENEIYSSVLFSGAPFSGTYFTRNYEQLYTFIDKQPQALGVECAKRFKNRLPFQIKILSLLKPMALVCHPSKVLAERLNQLAPTKYIDIHRKPKMIIALQYLEILVGFREKEEIFSFLSAVPELAILIPYEKIEDYLFTGSERYLKEIFFYLINATKLEAKVSLEIFFKRIRDSDNATKTALHYNILEKLQEQHPNDCGVYAPFFLNHIILNPGQAMFMKSGVPHTYITGDCLEICTCSRNVIRCGLTPRYKDCHQFVKAAYFRPLTLDTLLLQPSTVDIFVTNFSPPVAEFAVNRICIPEGMVYTLPVNESCSIAMVTRGLAVMEDFRMIKLGSTLFLLPYQKITLTIKKDTTIYTVFPNVHYVEGVFGNFFK